MEFYEYELLSARLSFATRPCFRYCGLRRKQEATTNVTIGAPEPLRDRIVRQERDGNPTQQTYRYLLAGRSPQQPSRFADHIRQRPVGVRVFSHAGSPSVTRWIVS